ncbi:hypothetical protein EPUS_05672 [Endocarpon pusillum Z07020]|uniref:Uncharacterized protein n=1 Tax=Endocarpon pusillum (strain Z07020 / HMAS-L-300199) TaxID=1263415 RepID=U1GKB7_ENDPU|nr:uncharacterized protein EPUS_05672 [Endocarpon pusillum Z07020]ERF72618.1 hypothetical protein EPUS_05672 [Endocarpon pusillum Z07020]
MNADDVLDILYYYWVLSDEYYPEERQRVQHAALNLFCASTTSRAGTIVESIGYLKQNQAVEYRDIQLYALQDKGNPGSVKLGMLITLRLLKGRRNRGNPPLIKFLERQDVPSFCLIKVICGLALKDKAFASK